MAGVLYFGDVDDKPIIGRFNEMQPVLFDTSSTSSTFMWSEFEQIADDEKKDGDGEKEESEYWNRRKRNKFLRRFKNKRKLHILDTEKTVEATSASAPVSSSFEGTLIEGDSVESGHKYVLLQVETSSVVLIQSITHSYLVLPSIPSLSPLPSPLSPSKVLKAEDPRADGINRGRHEEAGGGAIVKVRCLLPFPSLVSCFPQPQP